MQGTPARTVHQQHTSYKPLAWPSPRLTWPSRSTPRHRPAHVIPPHMQLVYFSTPCLDTASLCNTQRVSPTAHASYHVVVVHAAPILPQTDYLLPCTLALAINSLAKKERGLAIFKAGNTEQGWLSWERREFRNKRRREQFRVGKGRKCFL